jgi:uncharacterized protein YecT (DUF1311 family)
LREETVRNETLVAIAVGFGMVPLARGGAKAQGLDTPEPCATTVSLGDANRCWAREAERADSEMRQVYLTAVEKLPGRVAENLKKAQKLWLDFRDAHVSTLLGDSNVATYGPEYSMCLSILRWRLARDRTAELRRILRPDAESMCPL